MRHPLREFLWILVCLFSFALLPWWQSLICAALCVPLMLRLTEQGFKRRFALLFLSFTILFLAYHFRSFEISTAVAKTFRVPHFSILATVSAALFALVFALAGESVLWIKYSLRRLKQK